jgi:hypothetical protein
MRPLISYSPMTIRLSSRSNSGGLQGKSALPNDKWFSEPLTRLDYILMNMQSHLNAAQFIKHTLEDLSKKSFENTKSDPSISYNVGYKEPKGRIVIAATIDANGKPKKPMREICETVLETLKMAYPISPFGYAWHNNALGILQRDDADLYNKVVLELIESAVLSAKLNTAYQSGDVDALFQLGCLQQSDNEPITFYKYATPLATKR